MGELTPFNSEKLKDRASVKNDHPSTFIKRQFCCKKGELPWPSKENRKVVHTTHNLQRLDGEKALLRKYYGKSESKVDQRLDT
jgi:hypothetical protein